MEDIKIERRKNISIKNNPCPLDIWKYKYLQADYQNISWPFPRFYFRQSFRIQHLG